MTAADERTENGMASELKSQDRLVDAVCDRFEAAWRADEQPRIEDYLGEPSATADAVRELLPQLVMVDLEYRWRAAGPTDASRDTDGQPTPTHTGAIPARPRLEHYAARYPALGSADTLPLALIAQEYCVRCRCGDHPRLEEYRQRFVGRADALMEMLRAADASRAGDEPAAAAPEDGVQETLPGTAESSAGQASGGQLGAGDLCPGDGTRFRVLRFHAKGGLGQVMLALDRELGRNVALKEIQPRHADDPVVRERFRLEAEVTGGLEHPGIVPVYGLGAYPDGRPYYAMRFVTGDNLADAIHKFHEPQDGRADPGQRALELRQLLRRFIDVCHAVQYAHTRGVLHRDLKPGNVMLGKHGETLLVDWGLAKIVGRDEVAVTSDEATLRVSSGSGSQVTSLGSIVGTPAYMSPEQAAGQLDQIGPASDVYSLGATLYCLLTGKAPFAPGSDLLARVQRGLFPPPRQVQPQVPRALEAVCLKAMALQPAARYAAPHELVEEVERWMADEPVAVYRERFGERLARWSRRHRVWIRAGAIALTTVTLVSLGAAWLILRAWNSEARARNDEARARGHAEQRLVQARAAVDKWLTGVSEALRYYPVTNKARQRLLEQAAEDYERFVQQGAGDVALEIERGRTYLRLGHVRLILRDAPSAEQAYGEARRLFEQLLAENPENRECQVELANSLTDLGLLAMDLGNTPRADEYYRTAQGQLEPLHKQFPKSIPVRLALGTVLVNRAELLRSTARPADADAALRQALALLGGLTDELSDRRDGVPVASPEDRSLDREDAQRIADEATLTAASARTLLGYVLSDQGRYADAVSEIRAAASLAARLVTRDPHDPRYLELLADCQNYLAVCLRTIGRSDEEEDAYRQAIEHYAALCQALPAVADFEERLAITRTNRGSLLHKLGRVKDAEAELNEAQTILDRLVSRNPDVARCRSYQACCRDTLGQLHRDRGQLSQAQAAFRDAIKSYEALAASDRESVEHAERLALCRSHLGQTLQLLGQHSEAEQEFAAAIAGLSKLPPESPRRRYELAMVHQHRGRLWAGQAKADQAVADFGTAKRILSELASAPGAAEHRAEFAWLLVNCPHTELREPQAALRLADALTAEVSGNAHYHFLVGAALYRLGEFTKAIAALRQASHLRGFEHARDGFFLAMAYGKAGDRDQAQAAYRRAQQWFAANLPADQDLQRIQREAAEVIGVKTPPN